MPAITPSLSRGFSGSKFELVRYHNNPNIGTFGRVVIALLLVVLGVQFFTGWSARQDEIIDQNKSVLISGVVNALNEYYRSSSSFLEKRVYPVAQCSNELNSFDYEYTLRAFLTGRQANTTSHAYIAPNKFPVDPQGDYRDVIPDTTCLTKVTQEEQQAKKYFNGTLACDFNIDKRKNCFLYTSSLTGDSYKLAYWSPYYKRYVVYFKYREDTLQVKLY